MRTSSVHLHHRHRIAGGTWLGLVVGLLLGLGGALVVAIYVSKMPIPFIDRGLSRDSSQDAQEVARNKNWDPNAPLYGRRKMDPLPETAEAAKPSTLNPGHDQASGLGSAPAPAPAPTAPEAGPILPPKGADTTPEPTNTDNVDALNDPLGAFARARANAADPFNYFVQAGAFRQQMDAETFSAKLQKQGFDTRVSEREQAGRVVFRVRVGPIPNKAEAEDIQKRLTAIKVESALVRVQR